MKHFIKKLQEKDIYRIQLAHALKAMALSFVGIYIPIYLFHLGYELVDVIYFYGIFHVVGLFFGLFGIVPLMRHWGLIKVFQLYFFLQMGFLLFLYFLPLFGGNGMYFWVASVGGIATFTYWMPLNILFLKASRKKKMGSDLALLFSLPKVFSLAGPLLSALLIPIYGFFPMFIVAGFGLVLAYIPLIGIEKRKMEQEITFSSAWKNYKSRWKLFVLEMFDNIVEESEWFWGIFVFLIVGSLSAPGIVGALTALGGLFFGLFIGKYVNRYDKKLVIGATFLVALLWVIRFFVKDSFWAYVITLVASFAMSFFLISYFSIIYRSVKGDRDEEFLILREIPTVIGRMIVFGGILLFIQDVRMFFFIPIIALIILFVVLFIFQKSNNSLGSDGKVIS